MVDSQLVGLILFHTVSNFWPSLRLANAAPSPQCRLLLSSRTKHSGYLVMIWAAILWYSVGRMITQRCYITGKDYETILVDHVNSMVQYLFPNNSAVLQDENAPVHIPRIVQDWLYKHKGDLSHLL